MPITDNGQEVTKGEQTLFEVSTMPKVEQDQQVCQEFGVRKDA